MAHHQGMIFATINNILNNETLIKRFHKDPRICGVSSLLYERTPFLLLSKLQEVEKNLFSED
jgi:cyclic beta-1,2-glucan synthetase